MRKGMVPVFGFMRMQQGKLERAASLQDGEPPNQGGRNTDLNRALLPTNDVNVNCAQIALLRVKGTGRPW